MTHVLQREGVRLVAFRKSGCSSLITAFRTAKDRGEHYTVEADEAKIARLPCPHVTIGVFRHPLSRLASAWNHLIFPPIYPPLEELHFVESMSFPDFISQVVSLGISGQLTDPHLAPQLPAFLQVCGNYQYAELERMENLEFAWPRLVKTWGMSCTRRVPWLNQRRTDGWISMYDGLRAEVEVLQELYKRDFQTWNSAGGQSDKLDVINH